MHILLNVYVALLAASTSTKPKTSATSSAASLIFILLLGVLAYVFFIRPRSQQARRQRETLQEVVVGDEILTGAGIFGRVLDVESDRITIETAPGTRITVLRSTIARRLTEHPEEGEGWEDHETEADGAPGGRSGGDHELLEGHQDESGRGSVDGHDDGAPEGEEDTGGAAAGGGTSIR